MPRSTAYYHIALVLGLLLTTLVCRADFVVRNTGYVNYSVGTEDFQNPSNEVTMVVNLPERIPSEISFQRWSPQMDGGTDLNLGQSSFLNGTIGNLVISPDPNEFDDAVDLSQPQRFTDAESYTIGESIFVTVRDLDQNLVPSARETVLVTLTVESTGDAEQVQLIETEGDSGLFIGYIATTPAIAETYNGLLSLTVDGQVVATYTDVSDNTDISTAAALIDPFGLVFDSATGAPIDGATVRIVNAADGQPATVFADDGVTAYPSTVVTGSTVVDAANQNYVMPPGGYRFPLLSAGTYRLEVTPPDGYSYPSNVADGVLQVLPGAPFALGDGSRGEDFLISAGPALRIDVPVDSASAPVPGLYLRKDAAADRVSSGDFLRYDLVLENTSVDDAAGIQLMDTLPIGFRYQSGSTFIDGQRVEDPEVGANGRELVFKDLPDLTAGASVRLRYVVEVTVGAAPGVLKNVAQFQDGAGVLSNVAEAPVVVRDDLDSANVLMGRVMIRPTDRSSWTSQDQTIGLPGLEGARVYLEDGTYVITDKEGRFHFEGVKPGVHVVQLDLVSVPERYEAIAIENTRFAGRSYSQFVDCQPGILWRTDFFVAERAPLLGAVEAGLMVTKTEAGVQVAVPLAVDRLPMRRTRVMVMLPDGYGVTGSTALLGEREVPFSLMGRTVMLNLGELEDGTEETLLLELQAESGAADAEIKAMLFTDVGEQKNLKTGMLVASVGAEAESKRIEQALDWDQLEAAGVDGKAQASSDVDVHDVRWLNAQEATFEWVEPATTFVPAIPSIKMGIKFPKGHSVTLYNKGEAVSGLYLEGRLDGKQASVMRWRGLNLNLGANRFEAVLLDADGVEVERIERIFHYSGPPVRAEYVPEASILVADGRTQPAIALRLLDANGQPARPGVVGEYWVDAPYLPLIREERRNRFLEIGEGDDPIAYEVGEDGIALLKLEPTSQSGEVTVRLALNEREYDFQAWLEPALRDWILVGLGSGTVGYDSVSDNMEALGQGDVQDGYYDDGRIAFFAKGKVKGKWLLTAAYDNQKDTTVDGQQSLHQVIDPDRYYTLYGDETDQNYEAASAKKLYVKIERQAFYALYGDYDTGLTVTDLSRYNRSMTGVKSEYHGRNFTYTAFGSESELSYMRDEIRGNGTSGLYRLSADKIVINSDKIRIQTRDRFHSEQILSDELLVRHLDYSINYQDGTLYFKRPVYSKDENLNPIFIVAEYETSGAGEKNYNYGGRASVKTAEDTAELGASYIHEEVADARGDLYGADVSVDLNEQNELRAEVARSQVKGLSSDAEDAEGDAYLVELEHRSERVEAIAYYRQQSEGFGLGQQNLSESGTRKVGVDGRYRIDDRVDFVADVYHVENLVSGDTRDVFDAGFERRWDGSSVRLGYLWAEDDRELTGKERSDQIHLGLTQELFTDTLVFRADHYQSLGESNDNIDYPTRTIFGLDYYVNPRVRVFSEYELTQGNDRDTSGARVGMATQPWTGASIETAVQQDIAEDGGRVLANLGLGQSLQLTEHWSVDAGMDSSRTFSESGNGDAFNPSVPNASGSTEDFTAYSVGATYRETKWSWTGRLEQRMAELDQQRSLFTGIIGEVDEGLHMSLSAAVFDTQSDFGADSLEADLRYSIAYRPLHSEWIVLNRLDLLYDAIGGDTDATTVRIVDICDVNYLPHEDLQIAFQYGFKYVLSDFGVDSYGGFTDLVGFETRYDISKRFDLGLHGAARHSWSAHQVDYAFGPSVGFNPATNVWISLGYNVTGFYDEDFARARYTAQGPYVEFRVKVDQDTLKDIGQLLQNDF